jgi:flagellar hook-length control protein FliK
MKDAELNIGGVSETQFKLDNSLNSGAADSSKQNNSKNFKVNLDSSLNKIEKKRAEDSSVDNSDTWNSLMSIFGQSLSSPQAYAISNSGLLELGQKAGKNSATTSTEGNPIAITGSPSTSLNTQSQTDSKTMNKTQAASRALEEISAANIPVAPYNGVIPMSEFINGIGKFSSLIGIESIAEQIIAAAKLMKLKGRSELSVDIKPELLGDLKLSLKSENGIISIQIFASAGAKSLLDSNLADLQQSLASANIAVGGLEVFVNNNGSGKGFEEEAGQTGDTGTELSKAETFEAVDRLFFEQKLGYNTANSLIDFWG